MHKRIRDKSIDVVAQKHVVAFRKDT